MKKFEGILLVKENDEHLKPMWCLIENKKILFFDGQKSRLADKFREKLSEMSLEELSDDEDVKRV